MYGYKSILHTVREEHIWSIVMVRKNITALQSTQIKHFKLIKVQFSSSKT